MNLLIDLGNTRLKWCLAERDSLGEVFAYDYRQADSLNALETQWCGLSAPESIVIASVSHRSVMTELNKVFRSLWSPSRIILAKSGQTAFGVTNAYKEPEKLGVDRWLALLAAHRYYPGAVCVIDCGTAITVDVMQQDGRHLGGVICPGLRVMNQALATNTAGLPLSVQSGENGLAIDTQTAIANGIAMAAAGLIEQILTSLSGDFRLILTGGDAQFLAALLSRPVGVDSHLVFKGLLMLCQGEP
jgi:type III pantothenate kinase